MFINTKCHFDFTDHMVSLDFPKSILVKHTDSKRVHWHYFFQTLEGFDFKQWKLQLAKDLKEKYPTEFLAGKRPVSSKEGDSTGFQYVCKESAVYIHTQGFTDDEVEDLQKKNIEHVAQLKKRCFDWVVDKLTLAKIHEYTDEQLWQNYITTAVRYYMTEEKIWPQNHHHLCVYYCMKLRAPQVSSYFLNKLHR